MAVPSAMDKCRVTSEVSVPCVAGKEAWTITVWSASPSVTLVRPTRRLTTLPVCVVSSSVMVTEVGETTSGPAGEEAPSEETVTVSAPSASPSLVTARLKDSTALVAPAGRVMVKSDTSVKSPMPAVPPSTDTGTVISPAGRAG